MQTVSFSVDDELGNDLERISQLTGRGVSAVVEEAVRSRIDEMLEDAKDYADAMQGWDEYVASGKKGTKLEDFEKELTYDNSFVEPIQEAV